MDLPEKKIRKEFRFLFFLFVVFCAGVFCLMVPLRLDHPFGILPQDGERSQINYYARIAFHEPGADLANGLHKKNELLLEKGSVVTQKHIDLLTEHNKAWEQGQRKFLYQDCAEKLLLSFLFLIFGYICISQIQHTRLHDYHAVGAIAVLSLLLNGAFESLFLWVRTNCDIDLEMSLLFLPLALPALLIGTLYGLKDAFFIGLVTTGITAIMLGEDPFSVMIIGVIVCAATAKVVCHISEYKKFFCYSFLVISAGMFIGFLLFHLQAALSLNFLLQSLMFACLNGLATVMIAFFALLIIEPLFGIGTNMTYQDLTSSEHSCLKKMQEEAPGTWEHCNDVARIAEVAAKKIGANPFKAKVCALYHDVGKLKFPEYFTENIGGKDICDTVFPDVAAKVILSHTEKANIKTFVHRRHKFLIDAARCHHGTRFLEHFYDKAVKRAEESGLPAPKKEDFCYSGPLPHTDEEVILMLADCSEAKCKSLSKNNNEPFGESEIREAVEEILLEILKEGQLKDANMPAQKLYTLCDAVVEALVKKYAAKRV